MNTRPLTIPKTSRQQIQACDGTPLERAYIYLMPATWQTLRGLVAKSGKPTSQVIETLISAETGKSNKDHHDTSQHHQHDK
jgi:hypothetical protein